MKGHSERVPNKNIRQFHDQPLFFKILKTLKDSNFVDKIIINTDSDKIADMAMSFCPSVVINKRPTELCGDFVSTNKLIRYDIESCDAQYFLQTHATNPLLSTETLNQAIEIFFKQINSKSHDSVFSVTKVLNRFYDHNHKPINHNPQELIRTQDLPPLFEENSNFYIFSREGFLKHDNRIGTSPSLFSMDKLEAIDIDNEEDFILAEALYRTRIR